MVLSEQSSQPLFCETKKPFWVANFESCHGGVYITLKKIWHSRILRVDLVSALKMTPGLWHALRVTARSHMAVVVANWSILTSSRKML